MVIITPAFADDVISHSVPAANSNECLGILVHEKVEISANSRRFMQAMHVSESQLIKALNKGPIVTWGKDAAEHIYFRIAPSVVIYQAAVIYDKSHMVTHLADLQVADKENSVFADFLEAKLVPASRHETVATAILEEPSAVGKRVVIPISGGVLSGKLGVLNETDLRMIEERTYMNVQQIKNLLNRLAVHPKTLNKFDASILGVRFTADYSLRYFITRNGAQYVIVTYTEDHGPVEIQQIEVTTSEESRYFLRK
jgi:hypothetical protein